MAGSSKNLTTNKEQSPISSPDAFNTKNANVSNTKYIEINEGADGVQVSDLEDNNNLDIIVTIPGFLTSEDTFYLVLYDAQDQQRIAKPIVLNDQLLSQGIIDIQISSDELKGIDGHYQEGQYSLQLITIERSQPPHYIEPRATFTLDVIQISDVIDTDLDDSNTIAANAVAGAYTGVTAFAEDSVPADNISYRLKDDANGAFKIDATTGEVSVANVSKLGNEGDLMDIIVEATNSDKGPSETSFRIAIGRQGPGNGSSSESIGEVQDSNSSDNTINAAAPAGAIVGLTAIAVDNDGDAIFYELINSDGSAASNGAFVIDRDTGVVTVNDNSQFSGSNKETIRVRATSADGSTNEVDFEITITDEPLGNIIDTDLNDSNTIAANAVAGAYTGVTAFAKDSVPADNISYRLKDDANGAFEIDATSGEVSVADISKLGNESDLMNIIVEATSSDKGPSETSFSIAIGRQGPGNGNSSESIGEVQDDNVSDNTINVSAAAGAIVGLTAIAVDDDGDAIFYELINSDGSAVSNGAFIIDGATGVVTVNDNSQFNGSNTESIRVRATSADGSTNETNFNIAITAEPLGNVIDTDVDDSNTIAANAVAGAYTGVTALAKDSVPADNISYRLKDDANGAFEINATSGEVSVANVSKLGNEGDLMDIIVEATSSDKGPSETSFSIAIGRQGPGNGSSSQSIGEVQDSNSSDDIINAAAPAGAIVGLTAIAVDNDGDAIFYELINSDGSAASNGAFTIDRDTGVVTVNDNSQFSGSNIETIRVRATSADGSTNEADFDIRIATGEQSTVTGISVANDGNKVNEGGLLTFNVNLDKAFAAKSYLDFNLQGSADKIDDYSEQYTFTDGVMLSSDGTQLIVPAGTTKFRMVIQTLNDNLDELNESIHLNIDDATAVGTIIDNPNDGKPDVISITPNVSGNTSSDLVIEGQTLRYNVTMSKESELPYTMSFTIKHGPGLLRSEYKTPEFSNNVDYDQANNLLRIPAGVKSFTTSIKIKGDNKEEGLEKITLSFDGTKVTGGIVDNDNGRNIADVRTVTATVDDVIEGGSLRFAVNLTAKTAKVHNFSFSYSGTADKDLDFENATFSNGVKFKNGSLVVPKNVSSFNIRIKTNDDALDENVESVIVNVGGISSQGLIQDNDPGTGADVAKIVASSNNIVEGEDIVLNVSLSNMTSEPSTLPLILAGTIDAADLATAQNYRFSNNVSYDQSTGLLSLPANIDSFTVTIPTNDDTLLEGEEILHINIAGESALITIQDNDQPTVTNIRAADKSVIEGEDLVYVITLSDTHASKLTFDSNLTGDRKDLNLADITITGGSYNSNTGVITVDPGVDQLRLTIPTIDDNITEPTETFTLGIDGLSASIKVKDNDQNTAPIAEDDDFTPSQNYGKELFYNDGELGQFDTTVIDDSGKYAVAWISRTPDNIDSNGTNGSINVQFFDANDEKIGEPVVVGRNYGHTNPTTNRSVSIDTLSDGGVAVSWVAHEYVNNLQWNRVAGSQLISSSGETTGNGTLSLSIGGMNAADYVLTNDVVGLKDGGYITLDTYTYTGGWSSGPPAITRYNADGDRVGYFNITSEIIAAITSINAVELNNGDLVFSYSHYGPTSGNITKVLHYNSDGSIKRSSTELSTESGTIALGAQVFGNGNYVTSWIESIGGSVTVAPTHTAVRTQVFDRDGNTVGNETTLSTRPINSQNIHSEEPIALDDGNVLIAWRTPHSSGQYYELRLQVIDSNGDTVGNEVAINSGRSNSYKISSIPGGGFQVTASTTNDAENNLVSSRYFFDGTNYSQNDAPYIASSPFNLDVLDNDSDPEGDKLFISTIDGKDVRGGNIVEVTDSQGKQIGTAQVVKGEITFTPGAEMASLSEGELKEFSFKYKISDGDKESNTATVNFTVEGTSSSTNLSGDIPFSSPPSFSTANPVYQAGEVLNDKIDDQTLDNDALNKQNPAEPSNEEIFAVTEGPLQDPEDSALFLTQNTSNEQDTINIGDLLDTEMETLDDILNQFPFDTQDDEIINMGSKTDASLSVTTEPALFGEASQLVLNSPEEIENLIFIWQSPF